MKTTDLLEVLAPQVRVLARTEAVVGEPIMRGDTTIVSVSRVMGLARRERERRCA